MYRLRELSKEDIPEINRWRNNKELIDNLGAQFRYINLSVDEKWYEAYMQNRATCVRCAIADENNFIIGLISLTNINQINQSAVLHIMIGSEHSRNKGAGTYAVREILKHAFYNLNLMRIELNVLTENSRAVHLYEKCGFVREGTKRKATFKNGRFEDMHMYSILRNEFAELMKNEHN